MAGTTTNYSLPYPEPTDLVADYPALGQDLAEDLDTILAAKGDIAGETWTGTHNFAGATVTGIPSGLAFIDGAAPSSAASVSFDNCFSATYQNYLITWDLTTSASVEVLMRFRASSTDDTSSNYKMTHNRTSGSGGVDLSETIAYIPIGFTGDTVRRIGTMTVFGPYDASATFFMDQNYSACGTPNTGITGGRLDVAASKDGFTIYPVSGNITGIVRVYGIANA